MADYETEFEFRPEKYILYDGEIVRPVSNEEGYKAFYPDLSCRIFRDDSIITQRYETGKGFRVEKPIQLCRKGLHFCPDLHDVYLWYPVSFDIRICRVTAHGDVLRSEDRRKMCTDLLYINDEMSPYDIVRTLKMEAFNSPDYFTVALCKRVLEDLWYSIEGYRLFKSWAGCPFHCDVTETWLKDRYRTFREIIKDEIPKEVKKKCL